MRQMKKREPKFKVGDRVKHIWGKAVVTVVDVTNKGYQIEDDEFVDFDNEEFWEFVNEPESTHKFNIGDIVQRGCVQYKITGFDGNDYVAIDTVKLEHGLKSPFDITKIGIYDDEYELVKKAESNVQPIEPKFRVGDKVKRKVVNPHNPATRYIYTVFEIENDGYCLDHNDHESRIPISAQDEFELVNEPEPKFKLGVDLSAVDDIENIWRNTLTDLVSGVIRRNTDAFVWLIDETLKFMDCGAYEESAVNGMRIFAKELKKRLGV